MQHPRITFASAMDDHTLLVEFSNAEKRTYDVTKLLTREMFLPLRNPGFFKNFEIDSTGYALVWNEDVDISGYELWVHGNACADGAFDERGDTTRYAISPRLDN